MRQIIPATTQNLPSKSFYQADHVLDDTILKQIEEHGQARVIVELDVAFQPEGYMSKRAVTDQREKIAQTQHDVLKMLDSTQATVKRNFKYIPSLALTVTKEGLDALRQMPQVKSIHEDKLLHLNLKESIPIIGADKTWNSGFTGKGQAVAILDTGIDTSHPFLGGRVIAEACFSSNELYAQTLCPNGEETQIGTGAGTNCDLSIGGCTHGTHVAGIAAGYQSDNFAGVAKDSKVISIQVFSGIYDTSLCYPDTVPCALTSFSDVIAGLEHVLSLHNNPSFSAPIASINMSLGGDGYTIPCDEEYPFFVEIVENLKSVGIATIASSGNDSWINALGAPACISSVISVGATDDYDEVASFSNRAYFLDLLAPGVSIDSSVPGGTYGSKNGTSMAAPHVAGAWAVMRQANPSASVDKILNQFIVTGKPVIEPIGDVTTSRIQLDKAIEKYIPTPTPTSMPNLSIVKKAVQTVVPPGGEVEYKITFENIGSGIAEEVVITDIISSDITNVEYTFDGVNITNKSTSQYVWQVGQMKPLDRGMITIIGIVDSDLSSGNIINTVMIGTTSNDYALDNNTSSAQIRIPSPDLEIIMTAPYLTAPPGSPITYTLEFQNIGLATAENITIYSAISEYITNINYYYDSELDIQNMSIQPYVWQIPSMKPRDKGIIFMTGVIKADTGTLNVESLTSVAKINNSNGEEDSTNNQSSVTIALREVATSGVIFVKSDAGGYGTGFSWKNAYTELYEALFHATRGAEIWVAQGTYMPTNSASRNKSFRLKSGVAVYGGFNGTESNLIGTGNNFDERDWRNNPTILSGDINKENTISDNSYHVVNGSNADSTAILDGFIIHGGNASGETFPSNVGGGMYSDKGNPTLNNITFSNNHARLNGGGMYNRQSNPILNRVILSGNISDNNGGGMCNWQSNPILNQVIISGNKADNYGGAMCNYHGSHPILNHVTISGNLAQRDGGAMYNKGVDWSVGGLTINNSILWDNSPNDIFDDIHSTTTVHYAIVQGDLDGTNNLKTNPRFVEPISPHDAPTINGDFHIKHGSMAINHGNNNLIPVEIDTDMDNDIRILNGTVDMGAYESPYLPPEIGSAMLMPDTNIVLMSDDYENSVMVEFPVGSIDADTNVTYSHQSSQDISGMVSIGRFFELTATQGNTTITHFNKPVTITVSYPTDMPSINKNRFYLYRFSNGAWTKDGITTVKQTDTELVSLSQHFSLFAVLAEMNYVYLPLILK